MGDSSQSNAVSESNGNALVNRSGNESVLPGNDNTPTKDRSLQVSSFKDSVLMASSSTDDSSTASTSNDMANNASSSNNGTRKKLVNTITSNKSDNGNTTSTNNRLNLTKSEEKGAITSKKSTNNKKPSTPANSQSRSISKGSEKQNITADKPNISSVPKNNEKVNSKISIVHNSDVKPTPTKTCDRNSTNLNNSVRNLATTKVPPKTPVVEKRKIIKEPRVSNSEMLKSTDMASNDTRIVKKSINGVTSKPSEPINNETSTTTRKNFVAKIGVNPDSTSKNTTKSTAYTNKLTPTIKVPTSKTSLQSREISNTSAKISVFADENSSPVSNCAVAAPSSSSLPKENKNRCSCPSDYCLLVQSILEDSINKEKTASMNGTVTLFSKLLETGLNDVVRVYLLHKYSVPKGTLLEAPILNEEIAEELTVEMKKRDRSMKEKQDQLGHGLQAIHYAISFLPPKSSDDAVKALYNASSILADLHHRMTRDRIKEITSLLDKITADVLENSVRDQKLFGDSIYDHIDFNNVKKTINECIARQKSEEIRKTAMNQMKEAIESLKSLVPSHKSGNVNKVNASVDLQRDTSNIEYFDRGNLNQTASIANQEPLSNEVGYKSKDDSLPQFCQSDVAYLKMFLNNASEDVSLLEYCLKFELQYFKSKFEDRLKDVEKRFQSLNVENIEHINKDHGDINHEYAREGLERRDINNEDSQEVNLKNFTNQSDKQDKKRHNNNIIENKAVELENDNQVKKRIDGNNEEDENEVKRRSAINNKNDSQDDESRIENNENHKQVEGRLNIDSKNNNRNVDGKHVNNKSNTVHNEVKEHSNVNNEIDNQNQDNQSGVPTVINNENDNEDTGLSNVNKGNDNRAVGSKNINDTVTNNRQNQESRNENNEIQNQDLKSKNFNDNTDTNNSLQVEETRNDNNEFYHVNNDTNSCQVEENRNYINENKNQAVAPRNVNEVFDSRQGEKSSNDNSNNANQDVKLRNVHDVIDSRQDEERINDNNKIHSVNNDTNSCQVEENRNYNNKNYNQAVAPRNVNEVFDSRQDEESNNAKNNQDRNVNDVIDNRQGEERINDNNENVNQDVKLRNVNDVTDSHRDEERLNDNNDNVNQAVEPRNVIDDNGTDGQDEKVREKPRVGNDYDAQMTSKYPGVFFFGSPNDIR